MKRALLLTGAAAAVLFVWAVAIEPGRIACRERVVELPGWPPALHGLRVAAIGDIHTGSPHIDERAVDRLVALVNAERADVVLLLGDYVIHGVVGGRFVNPEGTASSLGALRAPGGVVAVLGNHDWWFDGTRVRGALAGAGIRVLENEAVRVPVRGTELWVAGLADAWTRTVDIPRALAPITPGAPVLLLTHNPDVFPEVPRSVSLTVAAHTHGGQVALPFVGRPVVPSRFGQRYAFGLVVENERRLFVTPGVGTSIIPVRFRVSPEASILVLESGA